MILCLRLPALRSELRSRPLLVYKNLVGNNGMRLKTITFTGNDWGFCSHALDMQLKRKGWSRVVPKLGLLWINTELLQFFYSTNFPCLP